jgi:hypothetical protein
MKKTVAVSIMIVACMVFVAGCQLFYGKDGLAYVKFTYDSFVGSQGLNPGFLTDGCLVSMGAAFPSSPSVNTEYKADAGSYTAKYVVYDNFKADVNADGWIDYCTDFNDPVNTIIWSNGYYHNDWSLNPPYYQTNKFSSLANSFSYTITVDKGSLFFQDGIDKHFTINLAWNTSNTAISSSQVPSSRMVVVEDTADQVTKSLTDGAYTLTLELKKNPATQSPLPSGSRMDASR